MLYKNLSQVGQKQRVCDPCGQNTIVQLCGATRCEPPGLVVTRPNDTARALVPCQAYATMYVGPNATRSISQDNLLLTHEGHSA